LSTALIGFCGAVDGGDLHGGRPGLPDQREARLWSLSRPRGFGRLIDMLVEASVEYLSMQVEAGADVLQIFDTWAGSLPPREFEAWVVAPTRPS
jgi:uroporphyrinogen decarboxylase